MPADTAISHQNTKVVLIANWTFPDWDTEEQVHNIPNIKINMDRLCEVFEKKVGIPAENIITIPNKKASEVIERFEEILKSAKSKEAALIVYYAGHGLPVSNKGLYWAASDTKMDNSNQPFLSRAIATDVIKQYLNESNIEKKILISDCCYAAEMLDGTQSAGNSFLVTTQQKVKIKGTFYMFSSDFNKESWFPADNADEPTYFTQALLNSLTDGVNPNEPYCTVGNIYKTILEKIEELKTKTGKVIPEPIKSDNYTVEQFILFKNPAYRNQAEIDLEQILADVSGEKLEKWMDENPNHPKWEAAFDALYQFNESMKELVAITSLPPEQRSKAYYEYTKKYKSNTTLRNMGYAKYKEVNNSLEKAQPAIALNAEANTINESVRVATPQLQFENARQADAMRVNYANDAGINTKNINNASAS